jgi:hypothetical protein
MNWSAYLLWGFIATLTLTTLMSGSLGLGLTRMNIPYMLGTIFTPNRDRAKLIGFFLHLVNGWLFALLYAAMFQSMNAAGVWRGALLGAAHAVVVLTIGAYLLPGLHPRMATEQAGPTARRQLEPPGFLAHHYGFQTPLVALIAHVAYGMILGAFYQPV